MSWNWKAYLDLAYSLLKDKAEASRRTAMSRSYYFGHHRATSYLSGDRASTGRVEHRHTWVINTLLQGNQEEAVAGRILQEIYRFRLQADYDDVVDNVSFKSLAAVERASRLDRILTSLEGTRSPEQ